MIPYTTIPFVSAFLLVLVGVLIGHVFWSSWRTKHRRIIRQLHRKVQQQRHELTNRSRQCEALSCDVETAAQCVDRQEDELEELRQACRQLQTRHEELTCRLAQETQARKDLAACLEDERQRHEAAGRQVDLLRKRVSEDQEEYERLRRKLADAQNLNTSLSERLKTVEESSLHSLAASQEQLDCATHELTIVGQRYAHLRREKEELAERLKQVEDERRQIDEQLQAARLAEARLESLADQSAQHRSAAEHWEAEAHRLSQQAAAQATEVERLTETTALLRKELEDLKEERQRLDDENRRLAATNESISGELAKERSERQQLNGANSRLRSQLDSTRQELDRLARIEDRAIELESQCSQAEAEIKRLRRERDDALQVEATSRRIVTELRDELNERMSDLDSLRRDKEAAASQLEFECRQRRQVAEALQLAESRLAALQAERDASTERHHQLLGQVTELTEQIRRWQTQTHEFEQRSLRAERQVAELSRQLSDQQELADKLRRRRFAASRAPDDGAESQSGLSFRDLRSREASTRETESNVLSPESNSSRVA